jgi:hypothetical protein
MRSPIQVWTTSMLPHKHAKERFWCDLAKNPPVWGGRSDG